MKRIIPLFALVACSTGFGQDGFGSGDYVELSPFAVETASYGRFDPRHRGAPETTCAVRLALRADCVTLRLTISSEAKRPEERIEALQRAYRHLKTESESNERVLLRTGYVELPLVKGRTPFLWSGKTDEEVSSFDATLITQLGEAETVFDRTAFLNEFIDQLDLGPQVRALFVSTGIGLLKLDELRPKLLRMIGDEYRLMKETFGDAVAVEFRGLDQRVQIRQLSEVGLEAYIPYSMVLRAGNGGGGSIN